MQDYCVASIREINSAKLHHMLESLEESSPLLIDVRQPQEYRQAHIPGALLIPLGQLELPHPALTAHDPLRPVVVYCRSGKRSMAGAQILCSRGFQDVMSLQDGILGWPYETLTGPPKVTLTPKETKTVQEILAFAMGREKLTRGFYRNWQEKVTEGPLHELLQELSFREEAHMEAIYNRYLNWCRQNALNPTDPEQFRDEAGAMEAKPLYHLSLNSTTELLEFAVEKEYEAYNFYKTSAAMVGDEEVKGLLLDLAYEERTHASSLLHLLSEM